MPADWVARHGNTDLNNRISRVEAALRNSEYDKTMTAVHLEILSEDEVFKKALAILSEEFKKKVCIAAAICPTCGAEITSGSEKADFDGSIFFTRCSEDKTHYNVEESSDYDYDDN